MTPLPLEQLGLRVQDHRSALWWLGILYRRPQQFRKQLEILPRLQALRVGGVLYLYALLHMVVLMIVLGILDHWVLFGVLGLEFANVALGVVLGVVGGIAVGIAVGIVGGITFGITDGILGGIAFGIATGIALGIAVRVTDEIAFGIALGIALGIAVGITLGIGAGVAYGIGAGVAFGITVGIALGIASLRAYYQFFGWLFIWPAVHGRWYPWHPVAWDDLCSLPFPGLDRLLAAYADHAPTAAQAEIERLIDHYPSQRMSALRAKTRLIARASAQETHLSRLDAYMAQLPEGDRDFLAQTSKVRAMAGEICQVQICELRAN